jgi:hypothetical protein
VILTAAGDASAACSGKAELMMASFRLNLGRLVP